MHEGPEVRNTVFVPTKNCVGSLCLHQSVSFLVANIVIRGGEGTAGPVPFFSPLTPNYTVGIREACE